MLGVGVGIVVGALLCDAAAAAGAGPADAQAAAVRAHLSASPEWRALLHYEPNWLHAGVHSEVASPWFFLAPDGATDPAAELRATLAALWSAKPIGPRKLPAYCLLVGRRKFLVRHLHIDTGRLPVHDCPGYRRWRAVIAPTSASLVFPAAFPNSPSSMFGHTLLRIDSARRRRGTHLLSYAVNFAAAAPNKRHGLDFVWKGLTGGYPGVFGLFPYYKKVKQYASIENRDVWSYPLHLTQPELSRLIDHVWAMDRVRFVYYFLNKNCAYQLLSLLDVARPSLHLTRRYQWYAIPSDTIRTLASIPGLLGPAHYRPSMATRLRWETRQLSDAQQRLARRIAAGRLSPDSRRLARLSPARRAGVLEVAYDALHYQLSSDRIAAPMKPKPGRRDADRILSARSRIHRPSPFPPVPTPAASPADGHRSLRINLSGVVADHRASLAFRIRPAYHDLLDNPAGYTRGAAIDFADLGLRLDPARARLRVDDFRLLSITSLTRRNAWFKPISFTLDTGVRRRPSGRVFTRAANGLGYYLQGGPGLSWGTRNVIGYVFGQASVDANPALRHDYALGVGPSAGLLWYPHPGFQFRVDVGWLQYALGAGGHYGWARIAAQCPLVGPLALRARVGYEDTAVDRGARVTLGVQAYF